MLQRLVESYWPNSSRGEPLDVATARSFSVLCTLAGASGTLVAFLNLPLFSDYPFSLSLGFLSAMVCLAAPLAPAFGASRATLIEWLGLYLYAAMLFMTTKAGSLFSSPGFLLLPLVLVTTLLRGAKVGGLGAGCVAAVYVINFYQFHWNQPIVRYGDGLQYVDWRLTLIVLLSTNLFIYLGAAFFREQMRRAMEALADARRAAEASSEAKAAFLANMSHEIRTPLNGVLGMLELAEQDDPSEARRKRLTTARSSAQGLLSILNDVLDASKLEAGRIELSLSSVDPRALIEQSAALFQTVALAKGVELTTRFSSGVPERIEIDPVRFSQILNNLVGNAAKFTDSGSITINVDYLAKDGGAISVDVIDTGAGISPSFLPQVFGRFEQDAASGAGQQGGSGLGLSICRQLIDLMGGQIGVDSTLGEGSRFYFSVPARRLERDVAEDAETTEMPVAPSGLRVLVVDDNAVNREVAAAFLKVLRCEVVSAPDGRAAVEIASRQAFDIIFMDISMPVLDGPGAMALIRASDGPNAAAPIHALTAHADPGRREALLAAGFDAVMTKPVGQAAFAAALATLTPAEKSRVA